MGRSSQSLARSALTWPGLMNRKPRLIHMPHSQGHGPTNAPMPLNALLRSPVATIDFPHLVQAKRPTS